jgi:hypothetical protein
MILFQVPKISALQKLELYKPELDERQGCILNY